MKRQDLDHRWQVSHIWDKDRGKKSVQEAGSWPEGWYGSFQKNRKTGCPPKKAQDLLFHIKRKSSTVKGKGWKPEKTLPGNDLLGADNTQKLLYIFAVVIYFFSDFSILYNSISSLRWEGLIRRESQNWRTKSIPGRRFPVIIRCSEVRSSPEEADN